MARTTFEIRGNLIMLVTEHGMDLSTFITTYGLTKNSVWAAIKPENYRRSGKLNESTAWKIVHAYRKLVHEKTGRDLSPAEAWRIVVEGGDADDASGNTIAERAA